MLHAHTHTLRHFFFFLLLVSGRLEICSLRHKPPQAGNVANECMLHIHPAPQASTEPVTLFPAQGSNRAFSGESAFVLRSLLYLIFIIIMCQDLHKCEGADIIKTIPKYKYLLYFTENLRTERTSSQAQLSTLTQSLGSLLWM